MISSARTSVSARALREHPGCRGKHTGSAWVVEGDYVGSHTIHQFQFIDVNAAALPHGSAASLPLQQRRPYPQWGILGTWAPIGYAKYNAGTATIKNNQWHGLTLQSNF